MKGRRLDPDERALWHRVAATVTPLPKRRAAAVEAASETTAKGAALPDATSSRRTAKAPLVPPPPSSPAGAAARRALATATLDSHWERRLRKGHIRPDLSIDLHGHSLASAHALLESALERAVLRGARVLLVVAGRVRPGPHHVPFHGEARPRGAIRAALPDWLASSPLAQEVIATRGAHASHGGAGALYVILRRARAD